MSIIAVQTERGIVEKDLNSLAAIMSGRIRGPRPEGATSIYKVSWWVRSDSFDGMSARIGSSSTPTKLHHHRCFVNKEKADELKQKIEAAFKVLEYNLEGVCTIEEDWYE